LSNNIDFLENLFDNFLKGPKIFYNREFLRPDYVPDHLPHRNDQIKGIGITLAPVLRGYRGSNLFIYGKTGTGKTAVVRHVLYRLIRKSREIGAAVESCYINCRLVGTAYRILAKLGESLGIKIPFTGLATSEVLTRFKTQLDAKQIIIIVVLDEIDALIKHHGDSLLYELTRINENLQGGRVSIVGISNDLRFKELLDPRVLSCLSEEERVFKPYTAPELQNILFERAQISFVEGVLSDAAINLCSAIAANEHGDARRALDLLRVAGELAEREESKKVTEKHVRKAKNEIEQDRVVMVLKTLPLHAKIVTCCVYFSKRSNIEVLTTGDLYERYQEICGLLGSDPLSQRRVSDLINELDVLGILNARVTSLGRYGRTKKIRLGIALCIIKTVFAEDPWINQIIKLSS
jgi:cell division control protein 6